MCVIVLEVIFVLFIYKSIIRLLFKTRLNALNIAPMLKRIERHSS